MKKFMHLGFRLCVFAFDAARVMAEDFVGVDVCHWAKLGIAFSFALMQKKQKIKETRDQNIVKATEIFMTK